MKKIFLTGATGFLGGYLSYLLIQQGFKLTLLVRAASVYAAKERYFNTLNVLFPKPDSSLIEERVTFIPGDLLEPETLMKVAGPGWDTFIHCAASTDFHEKKVEEMKRINLGGTRAALQFSKQSQIPSFHYISTAYVAGLAKGKVKENIQVPAEFRNPYEEVKSLAERIVFSFCLEHDIRLTIHRPSIILGDSREGRTLKFEGPYLFLKQIDLFCRWMRRQAVKDKNGQVHLDLRVPAFEGDEQNYVTVDYVSKFIAGVVSHETLEGKIYHITHSNPPTMGDIYRAFRAILPFSGLSFVGDVEVAPENPIEERFFSNLATYLPYLKPRLNFDKTNASLTEDLLGIQCSSLSVDRLRQLFHYSLRTHFGKKLVTSSI